MIKQRLIFWIFLFFIPTISYQQDYTNHLDYWQYYSDNENSLYKTFCTTAFSQLDRRQLEINNLDSEEDWLSRQKHVLDKLKDIVGPFPEKTPLNAKITGKLKKDGFMIEKLIYESIPGYFVTAAMYIPEGVKKNAPAIFYVCGHSPEGFRVVSTSI